MYQGAEREHLAQFSEGHCHHVFVAKMFEAEFTKERARFAHLRDTRFVHQPNAGKKSRHDDLLGRKPFAIMRLQQWRYAADAPSKVPNSIVSGKLETADARAKGG